MKEVNIESWPRRKHFEHFSALADPFWAVTIPFDLTQAYKRSKAEGVGFFTTYLHDCLTALNGVDAFRYRIIDGKVVEYDCIHASATMLRPDNTFGFSFINYDPDIKIFSERLKAEKARIVASHELFPPYDGLDCIHCSAIPWFKFVSHKEPVSGRVESVPKFAFSRTYDEGHAMMMNVAISVNHALVDGYHLGLFAESFQDILNS